MAQASYRSIAELRAIPAAIVGQRVTAAMAILKETHTRAQRGMSRIEITAAVGSAAALLDVEDAEAWGTAHAASWLPMFARHMDRFDDDAVVYILGEEWADLHGALKIIERAQRRRGRAHAA